MLRKPRHCVSSASWPQMHCNSPRQYGMWATQVGSQQEVRRPFISPFNTFHRRASIHRVQGALTLPSAPHCAAFSAATGPVAEGRAVVPLARPPPARPVRRSAAQQVAGPKKHLRSVLSQLVLAAVPVRPGLQLVARGRTRSTGLQLVEVGWKAPAVTRSAWREAKWTRKGVLLKNIHHRTSVSMGQGLTVPNFIFVAFMWLPFWNMHAGNKGEGTKLIETNALSSSLDVAEAEGAVQKYYCFQLKRRYLKIQTTSEAGRVELILTCQQHWEIERIEWQNTQGMMTRAWQHDTTGSTPKTNPSIPFPFH